MGTPPNPQNRQLLRIHSGIRSSGDPQSSQVLVNDKAPAASSSESNSSFGFSSEGKAAAAAVVRVLTGSSRQTLVPPFMSAQLPHTQ